VSDLPATYWPSLGTPEDVVRILAGDDTYDHVWPPPGTTAHVFGLPEPAVYLVQNDPSAADPDTTYWAPIAEVYAMFPDHLAGLMLWAAGRLDAPAVAAAGGIGHWPYVWRSGEGKFVKWIRSVFRGQFGGGIEQWQFKLDWGNEGADPTLSESGATTAAADFGGYLTTSWNKTSPYNLKNYFMADVEFTEVGIASFHQDDPMPKPATGDIIKQDYPMAWNTFSVATRPKGTAASGLTLPFEVALAVTLQTDTRGPRGRGRCYLPAPSSGTALAGGGVFTPALATDACKFIGDLAAAVKAAKGWDLIVVSSRAKQLHKVTTIQCGKVPDSQRRRRRSQDEAKVIGYTVP